MLYLTDLPFGISTQDIQEFLSKYRDKIIFINPDQNPRNRDKRRPLAIKVLFKDYESANNCRIEMNLRKMRGKSVRIMWDERDASIRHNTKNNLFIKGIPKTTTPREVYEYFLKFGDISSCKINEDEQGNHLGYGYITYYNLNDAQKAIDETKDKKIFDTNNLEVSHFQKRNERIINSNELNNQKIYVSNIPEKYTTTELTKLCSEFGNIQTCNIYIDNLGKNFGIVQFSSPQEAKDAVDKLDGKEIDKNKLMVKLYQTKYEHKQYLQNSTQRINDLNANCNLIIKNLPLTAKEEDLIIIFSKYGTVTSARIEKNKLEKKDEKGKFELVSKGFGYISFDKPENAKNAMDDLNGKYLPGFESWSKTLTIELFMTKHERQFVENKEINLSPANPSNYFMSNQNDPKNYQNFMGSYPYPYPYNYPHGAPLMYPMPFNQNSYYGNNYGFKRNRRGGYNNNYYRNNNYRNNNYKNNNYNNKYKEKKQKVEQNEEKKKKIDLTEYNNLQSLEDKKDFLGEKVFKAIEESAIASEKKVDMETIGKITGMIIELPNQKEIIEILENPSILDSRIEEALKLLGWKA